MRQQTTRISPEDISRQLQYCREVAALSAARPAQPLAFVDTYGCQQNEADSERIRGYLREMGYGFTQDEEQAQIIVLNTCAIREHAEQRVLGNLGALVHVKRRHPEQIICVCGCMAQEAHVAEKIKQSFRHVDLVFGPHALWRFPEFIHTLLTQRGRVFQVAEEAGSISEGIPVVRQDRVKAWVSIMYGCNNFCSYCIVPYVRGRERSRRPEDILAEVEQLAAEGYRDITLLGQNVNSYGKDLEEPLDFADLLERVNAVPGDFLIRFMTSHPKDATQKLFETMARCGKVAPVLHLPFQAGNDRVLRAMNRHYDRAQYLDEVRRLKELIPDIVLTSDVIVGFPGETTEEFEETLSLLEQEELTPQRRLALMRELKKLTGRMEWLVEALLKMAQLDAGTVVFHPQDTTAAELVRRAAEPLEVPMEVRSIRFTAQAGEERLTCDVPWSTEALGNILKNCMEHAASWVQVTARETAIFTEITVQDDGPGFDPEELPRLFQRFYRGKNAGENNFGIGLSLSRQVLAQQNGTVQAENVLTGGARFILRWYKGTI